MMQLWLKKRRECEGGVCFLEGCVWWRWLSIAMISIDGS